MISIANIIGSVVTGRIRRESAISSAFDTHHVLGTGFAIDPSTGLCVTCSHVISEEDIQHPDELGFFALSEIGNFSVHPILKSSIRRHPSLDVLTFKVANCNGLRTWSVMTDALSLAQDVLVIGVARDHAKSKPGDNTVVSRALRSYVVSDYQTECEIDKPLITTMSGSPVLVGNKIAGIACSNRQYSIDQYVTETIDETINGTTIKKEVYEYKETARLGVFLKASSWIEWVAESNT